MVKAVKTSRTFTLDELKNSFKHYTYALTLECGGNGKIWDCSATSELNGELELYIVEDERS